MTSVRKALAAHRATEVTSRACLAQIAELNTKIAALTQTMAHEQSLNRRLDPELAAVSERLAGGQTVLVDAERCRLISAALGPDVEVPDDPPVTYALRVNAMRRYDPVVVPDPAPFWAVPPAHAAPGDTLSVLLWPLRAAQ